MRLPSLTTALVSTALLVSTLSCAKKDDPVATPTNTGSYKLDGTAVTCQVQAVAYSSPATSNAPAYDMVEISLTTTPQPASGAQVLKTIYYKPASTNTYTLSDIGFYANGSRSTFYYSLLSGTLTRTSGGGFSGTFAANIADPNGNTSKPELIVSDGVLTDVRP